MKKVIALIMCLVVVLSIAASASASKMTLHRTITSMDKYVNGTTEPTNNANGHISKRNFEHRWRAPFTGPEANKRIVARVYGVGNTQEIMSATWVYTTRSYTYHPFKPNWVNEPFPAFLGVKLDDRDGGVPVTISGTFEAAS